VEEKKKKLEKLYHEMLKNIQDYGVILLDVDGTVLTWNKGAQEIKGYKAEEIIGKNFRVFYTARDREENFPKNYLHSPKRKEEQSISASD